MCPAAEMKLEALARESENGVDISDNSHSASVGLPGSKERVLKFELQMYKMRDGEYCIDIQVNFLPYNGMSICQHLNPAASCWSQHGEMLRDVHYTAELEIGTDTSDNCKHVGAC